MCYGQVCNILHVGTGDFRLDFITVLITSL